MTNEQVYRVCQFLCDEAEIAGREPRTCKRCELKIESPYGLGVLGCVLRAQQLIALVQSEPPDCPKCGVPHYPNCDQQMKPETTLVVETNDERFTATAWVSEENSVSVLVRNVSDRTIPVIGLQVRITNSKLASGGITERLLTGASIR